MGARDALTFGLGDNVMAGIGALVGPGGVRGYGERYRANLDKEKAQDAYDAKHYGLARGAGQVAGTVGQFAVLGPAGGVANLALRGGVAAGGKVAAQGLLKAAPRAARAAEKLVEKVGPQNVTAVKRVKQHTPLQAREAVTVAAGGAGVGAGGEAVTAAIDGRPRTVGDYAGAAAGGALGALGAVSGLRLTPGQAGMVAGGATSALQDAFNGQAPSLERATDMASAGGWTGAAGEAATRAIVKPRVNALKSFEKGLLGEKLSDLRTLANWEWTLDLPEKVKVPVGVTKKGKRRVAIPDRYIVRPWSRHGFGHVESKFGPSAHLTRNQKDLWNMTTKKKGSRPQFRVDHFTRKDLDALGGIPAGLLGVILGDHPER